MWYVVQVLGGNEERVRVQCEALRDRYPDAFDRVFIPLYEEKMKIRGEWELKQKILFPGYIFIITDYIQKTMEMLREVSGLTKLLGDDDGPIPISGAEEEFLKRIGGEEQVVDISEGIIEGTQVKVMRGPLMGLEALIRKIDRHRRKAWLEIDMFGEKRTMEIGLEVLEKKA